MRSARGIAAILLLGLVVGPGSGARSADEVAGGAGSLVAGDNPCLLPEEQAVVGLMAVRSRGLDQREELVVLQEQALLARQNEVQAELERLAQLRREIEELIASRATARTEGADALVLMVGQMRSSDAAGMLSEMDPMLAAAVLERLSPRQAGRILGGMDARIAARLSSTLAVDPIEVSLPGKEAP